jgi:GTP cyclohydrolase I
MKPHARITKAATHYKKFCETLGINISLPDTVDTPRRVAKMFAQEFTAGAAPADFTFTTFPADPATADQLVTVAGVRFTSICRHHHLPVVGYIHFGYIPGSCIVGLSKIPRAIQWMSAKPTVQEEMTHEIVDWFFDQLKPRYAAVSVIGLHNCMACRGVHDYESRTITNAIKVGPDSTKQNFADTTKEFLHAIDLWYKSKGLL